MFTLDELAANLRTISSTEAMGVRIAARAVPLVGNALRVTLVEGVNPDNSTPWSPTKMGKRAYANAASRLTTKSDGNLVYAVVSAPEAYAQDGTGRLPVRQMLPTAGAGIPKNVADAITKAAAQVLDDTLK